jgi:O-antigen/teichoic acid export membrane protein
MKFRLLALLQVLDAAVTFFLVFGMLAAGLGIRGLIIGMAVGQAVAGLTMAASATYILYRDKLGPWWRSSFEHVASMRRELGSLFGWNYLLVTLSGLLVQVPVMLLGRFRGPEEAGFFRLATSISVVGSYMENSLVKVTYPVLSARWVGGGIEGIRSVLKRWMLGGGVPLGILLALAIPLLPVLIPPVFGTGYRPMIAGTQLLLAGMVASAIVFWLNPAYFALGRIDIWTKVFALQVLLVFGFGVLLIPGTGFFGMAGIITVGKLFFVVTMLSLFPRCLKNAA